MSGERVGRRKANKNVIIYFAQTTVFYLISTNMLRDLAQIHQSNTVRKSLFTNIFMQTF